MSGKGSSPRPLSVPRAEYDRRWQETFAPTKRYRVDALVVGLTKLGIPVEKWPIFLCEPNAGLTHSSVCDCGCCDGAPG